jgi:hypothetical protein
VVKQTAMMLIVLSTGCFREVSEDDPSSDCVYTVEIASDGVHDSPPNVFPDPAFDITWTETWNGGSGDGEQDYGVTDIMHDITVASADTGEVFGLYQQTVDEQDEGMPIVGSVPFETLLGLPGVPQEPQNLRVIVEVSLGFWGSPPPSCDAVRDSAEILLLVGELCECDGHTSIDLQASAEDVLEDVVVSDFFDTELDWQYTLVADAACGGLPVEAPPVVEVITLIGPEGMETVPVERLAPSVTSGQVMARSITLGELLPPGATPFVGNYNLQVQVDADGDVNQCHPDGPNVANDTVVIPFEVVGG